MLRVLYITGTLLLLFTSCNNRPVASSSLSAKEIDSIDFFLKKELAARNVDSSLYWANRAYKLSAAQHDQRWMAKTQLVFSRIHRNKHEDVKGKENLQKALIGLKEYGTKEDLGDALIEQVHYFDDADYLDSSIPTQIGMIEQASLLYNQAGANEKYAAALCKMGYLYYMKGGDSTHRIMDTLKKALSIYKGGNGCQYVYDAMAMQYAKDGSWPQAMDLGLHAVNAAEKFNDTSHEVKQLYNNLSAYYFNLKKYNESIPYAQKTLAIDKKNHDTASVIEATHSIVSSYYMSRQYNEAIEVLEETEREYNLSNTNALMPLYGIGLICYTATGKYKMADLYHAKLLQYSTKLNVLDQSQAYVYTYLIEYYLRTNKYKDAEKYCIITDTFMRYYKISRMIGANYNWWSSADSGLGHFEAAFNHVKIANQINDTLYNGETQKQLNELKIKYETENKEQNIQLLTKQSLLQNSQLQHTKLTKNLLWGCAGMLTLLLALGLNRYRLKQRNNRALQAKQEEINLKNESLEKLLCEKEWLIKEIHHRVKNNLQIVMSLLNTQSMYLSDEAAVKAINESQHRMQAMSLIHQKLYQSDNVTAVNMLTYIAELIDYLRESIEPGKHLSFRQDIEPIELDVAQAIPVGLILNEAITNSIKYAFPTGEGVVSISMKLILGNHIILHINDNGIGLPTNVDSTQKSRSLGMNLIKGLTNQLDGDLVMTSDHGFKISIKFPYISNSHDLAMEDRPTL